MKIQNRCNLKRPTPGRIILLVSSSILMWLGLLYVVPDDITNAGIVGMLVMLMYMCGSFGFGYVPFKSSRCDALHLAGFVGVFLAYSLIIFAFQ